MADHSSKDRAISLSLGSLFFVSNGEESQVTQERNPSGQQFYFFHLLSLLAGQPLDVHIMKNTLSASFYFKSKAGNILYCQQIPSRGQSRKIKFPL